MCLWVQAEAVVIVCDLIKYWHVNNNCNFNIILYRLLSQGWYAHDEREIYKMPELQYLSTFNNES